MTYLVQDLETFNFYIKTDKEGNSFWTSNKEWAKKFSSYTRAFRELCKLDCLGAIVEYKGRGC